jgi:thiol-disulfide isomerase/thioredoxin
MKVLAVLYVLFSFVSAVVARASGGPVALTGRFPSKTGQLVTIKNSGHFSLQTRADKAGRLKARFIADTGYYTIDQITVYLEPGMDLVLRVTPTGPHFTGKGAAVNDLLQQLDTLIRNYLPFTDNALSEKANFIEPAVIVQSLTDYRGQAKKLLATRPFSPYFLSTQNDAIDYTVRYYANAYSMNYGIDPQKQRDFINSPPDFKPGDTGAARKTLASIQSIKVKSMPPRDLMRLDSIVWRGFATDKEALYGFSAEYRQLLDTYLTRMLFFKPGKYLAKLQAVSQRPGGMYESKIDIVRGEITGPVIREALLYQFTRQLLDMEGNDTSHYYTDYLRDAIDTANVAMIRGVHDKLQRFAAGASSPEFVYPDVHDATISLSSLRGHYVYIDVWATWCGPCKAELPFLKEVEKKYEGRNIRFVGLSVDVIKDADKWKKFVTDNGLEGCQVMADHDFTSDFIADFNITSIPRFILIDPEGKIVSANASRPSNPALAVQLTKLLE